MRYINDTYWDYEVYKTKGLYSVRWTGEHKVRGNSSCLSPTVWGPDRDGRVCRLAAFYSLGQACEYLERVAK